MVINQPLKRKEGRAITQFFTQRRLKMPTIKKELLLGAHMSIAGGVSEALIRGDSIGCTAIQIFTTSSRQWHAKDFSPEEIEAFQKTQRESSIACVLAHANYLINLGSPNASIHKKSVFVASKELAACQALGIPFLILHPGAYTSSTSAQGCKAVAQGINALFEQVPGKTMILLETMAGQGTALGSTFEELATICDLIDQKNRVGICLDTAHIFAVGYNFSTPQTYKKLWDDFDRIIGLSHLKAIHLNDSKKECGSRVDRHEGIGEGAIGLEGFRLLMNDERLLFIPKILETPKATLQDDLRNLKIIRALFSEKTKKSFGI